MSTPRNYPKKQQKINNTTKLEFIYQVMALKRTVKEVIPPPAHFRWLLRVYVGSRRAKNQLLHC